MSLAYTDTFGVTPDFALNWYQSNIYPPEEFSDSCEILVRMLWPPLGNVSCFLETHLAFLENEQLRFPSISLFWNFSANTCHYSLPTSQHAYILLRKEAATGPTWSHIPVASQDCHAVQLAANKVMRGPPGDRAVKALCSLTRDGLWRPWLKSRKGENQRIK